MRKGAAKVFSFTLRRDLACANQVTLITDKDDGSLGLVLPQEEPELSGTVEATPVSHGEHQHTHLAQQSRQILRDGRTRSCKASI